MAFAPPETTAKDEPGVVLFRLRGAAVVLSPTWWLGSLAVIPLCVPLVGRLVPGIGIGAVIAVSITFAISLGVSVLAHELGHCVAALSLGMPVRRIRLSLLGGVSELGRTPRRPHHEGWVAAAGPAVSLLLAGVFGLGSLVVAPGGAARLVVVACAVTNLAVAVFNLLPGLPLDGGRMLRAGVWAMTGQRRIGTRAAIAGGAAVMVALVVWTLAGLVRGSPDQWLRLGACVLVGWHIARGVVAEKRSRLGYGWPEGLSLADVVRPPLFVPADSPVGDTLVAAAGRGVLLVRPDGVADGLLDELAARRLAAHSPAAPADAAAQRIRPDAVLFGSEPGEEIIARVRDTLVERFVIVDDHGRPTGLLRREDLRAMLAARSTS